MHRTDLLNIYAQDIEPIDGYEDVVCHADRYGFEFRNNTEDDTGENVSVAELANYLRRLPSYHGGDIRLIACESGADGAITAQALADALGVNVLAPSDIVWVHNGGKVTIGPDQQTDSGEWRLFRPRKRKERQP